MIETDQYSKSQRVLKVLLAFLVFLPWISTLAIGLTQPIEAVSSGFVMATALLCVYSFMQARVERKYRHVTATWKDYFVANIPIYFFSLIPGFFGLGFLYLIPEFGLWTIVYVDAVITCIYLVFARFPIALRIGQRATRIQEGSLTVSFLELAKKTGIENVELYTVDWKKFKVANAFQVGPRKFSVYCSNDLLEEMPVEEAEAVLAHKLAHAKKKHVAKSLALFVFPEVAAMNLSVYGAVMMQRNIGPRAIAFLVGLLGVFIVPQIGLRFQRRFELEADAFAAMSLGDGKPVINALNRLAKLNLIPAEKGSPTHPSIRTRVQRIEQLSTRS